MDHQKILTQKIIGLYTINKEIGGNITGNLSNVLNEHYRIKVTEDRPPNLKLIKYESQVENILIFGKKVDLKIKEDMFKQCENEKKTFNIKELLNENDKQFKIAEKYMQFDVNEKAFEQLNIIKENMENIQVAIGSINEFLPFKEEEEKKEIEMENSLKKINTLINEVFKKETRSKIALFIFESRIIKNTLDPQYPPYLYENIFEKFAQKIPTCLYNSKTSSLHKGFNIMSWYDKCFSGDDIMLIFDYGFDEILILYMNKNFLLRKIKNGCKGDILFYKIHNGICKEFEIDYKKDFYLQCNEKYLYLETKDKDKIFNFGNFYIESTIEYNNRFLINEKLQKVYEFEVIKLS